MIYVSTANVRQKYIKDSVGELVAAGFKNIELSGGTHFYPEFKNDLLELRAKHNLNYRVHNYFPPPTKSFVLNLASADPKIVENSQELIRRALDLSVEFGSQFYGFHAGFRINPNADELGQAMGARNVTPYEEALNSFAHEYSKAQKYAEEKGVQLFVENNVVSATNFKNFGGVNPFLLTNKTEFYELKRLCPLRLLLDVAHLKVSCNTLGLNFASELREMAGHSEYIHLSDNDGLSDSNLEIHDDSELYGLLKELNLKNKTLTLEIGESVASGVRTFERVERLTS